MIAPAIRSTTLVSDTYNINAHPTRHRTATLGAKGVTLDGTIRQSHVFQTGRRGTAADRRARTFRGAMLLPSVRSRPDGLADTPPMGWNSWHRLADRIDDATVRAMADAMVSTGLRDGGYGYVNIDGGRQGGRDAVGVLHPGAEFPRMKALTDYVHARRRSSASTDRPGRGPALVTGAATAIPAAAAGTIPTCSRSTTAA